MSKIRLNESWFIAGLNLYSKIRKRYFSLFFHSHRFRRRSWLRIKSWQPDNMKKKFFEKVLTLISEKFNILTWIPEEASHLSHCLWDAVSLTFLKPIFIYTYIELKKLLVSFIKQKLLFGTNFTVLYVLHCMYLYYICISWISTRATLYCITLKDLKYKPLLSDQTKPNSKVNFILFVHLLNNLNYSCQLSFSHLLQVNCLCRTISITID